MAGLSIAIDFTLATRAPFEAHGAKRVATPLQLARLIPRLQCRCGIGGLSLMIENHVKLTAWRI